MSKYMLAPMESRFADILWDNEPLSSTEMVRLAEEEFNWARTTTYTVLKKLILRGLFENNKGTVREIVSREQFDSYKSACFVDDQFKGSLPAFIAAFTSKKKISAKEAEELRRMIDEAEEN